jgi:hypothetical protein
MLWLNDSGHFYESVHPGSMLTQKLSKGECQYERRLPAGRRASPNECPAVENHA